MNIINGNYKEFDGKDVFREKLKFIIEKYRLNLFTLSKVVNIKELWLQNYLEGKNNFSDLSMDKQSFLSNMIMLLCDGMEINADDRIRGIVDVLLNEFKISYETLCLYSKVELEDFKNFMNGTAFISYEVKYKLSVTILFLHYLFKG